MATTTKAQKKEPARTHIMATSFIKSTRKKSTGVKVLTTDNTLDSYPVCKMSELHKLANKFGWIIFPVGLCDFERVIKEYAKENIYYAWELYNAYIRFMRLTDGEEKRFIIAPPSYIDTYRLITESRALNAMFEDTYYPESLKGMKDAFEILKPILIETRAIVDGMTQKINEYNRLKEKERKESRASKKTISAIDKLLMLIDPCIFSVPSFDDIHKPKANARIGLCWGEPLQDFIVDDLPNNNGAFSSVTFPWSKDMMKEVTLTDLDADMEIRTKYAEMEKAINAISEEIVAASEMRWWKRENERPLDRDKLQKGFDVLKKMFNISSTCFQDLRKAYEYMEEYFTYDGTSSCPGAKESLCDSPHSWGCTPWKNGGCYFKRCNANAAMKRIGSFYSEIARTRWITEFGRLYNDHQYKEFLEFIPLIMEKEAEEKYIIEEFKKGFPTFWAFYKMVTT